MRWTESGALILAVGLAGCWRTGEPTPGPALVVWTAYPESVRVGEVFSLEFAGPVAPNACGRLDTATLTIREGEIELDAQRSTFRAICANQRISFYEARPISLDLAGSYAVRTRDGRELGTVVATDSGPFSRVRTRGEGTIDSVAGCLLFGPGWIGGQRVFALRGLDPEVLELAGTDQRVHVEGELFGFSACNWYGSRPRIVVDTAWAVGGSGDDYYRDEKAEQDES